MLEIKSQLGLKFKMNFFEDTYLQSQTTYLLQFTFYKLKEKLPTFLKLKTIQVESK